MDKFQRELDWLTSVIASKLSAGTKAIRIERTGMKQWQKSAMLRKHAAKWGEPPLKWNAVAKTMDTRKHTHHEGTK